jgi:hypothetical protein
MPLCLLQHQLKAKSERDLHDAANGGSVTDGGLPGWIKLIGLGFGGITPKLLSEGGQGEKVRQHYEYQPWTKQAMLSKLTSCIVSFHDQTE